MSGTMVLGLGLSSGASAEDLLTLAEDVLKQAGKGPADLRALATLDRRADHAALVALAERWGLPVMGLSAPALAAVAERLATPSAAAARHAGVPGVAEAAALAALGEEAVLLVPRRTGTLATAALAAVAG